MSLKVNIQAHPFFCTLLRLVWLQVKENQSHICVDKIKTQNNLLVPGWDWLDAEAPALIPD